MKDPGSPNMLGRSPATNSWLTPPIVILALDPAATPGSGARTPAAMSRPEYRVMDGILISISSLPAA
jgi:hypothetical protein